MRSFREWDLIERPHQLKFGPFLYTLLSHIWVIQLNEMAFYYIDFVQMRRGSCSSAL